MMLVLLLGLLDPATGEEVMADQTTPPATEMFLPASGPKAGSILWDYTHGVFCVGYCYDLSDMYSKLATMLTSNGYSITTTAAGVNNVNLDLYDIVVICLPCNWNSAYSAAEADSLAAFVSRGGSLLVISENTACPNGNLTQVANRFNFSVGLGNPAACFSSFTANPVYSSIFVGVVPGNVCTAAPGSVGAAAPSELIGWRGAEGGVAGRCVQGQGGVILIGDANHWDSVRLYNGDNDELALQTFAWLSAPPCAPTHENVDESPTLVRKLSVLPNPAGDFLMVTLPSGISEATLYDITGAPVLQVRDGKNDLRSLKPGVYLLVAGDRVRRVIKL